MIDAFVQPLGMVWQESQELRDCRMRSNPKRLKVTYGRRELANIADVWFNVEIKQHNVLQPVR